MRILVTGASGFVGCHTVQALVEAGHEVRVLARTPSRVDLALRPLGAPFVEIVPGDVTDRAAVERAVVGVNGVLHAAAVYTFDTRKNDEMFRINVEGTRHVLEVARTFGCDPIVHVSSTVALYPMRAPVVGAAADDPPLGTVSGGYPESKRNAEKLARALAAQGAPIVITHPGAVLGPNDPGPGEQAHLLRNFLGNRYPFILFGAAMHYCDVRWIARAHAALFSTSERPRHVMMTGAYVTWPELFRLLRALTGRRLPTFLISPKPVTALVGRLVDLVQRFTEERLPLSGQQAMAVYSTKPADNSLAERLAGPSPPLEDTLREAITWLAATGQIPSEWAGQLAGPPTAPRLSA